jgi:NAD-dependent DNA ligase
MGTVAVKKVDDKLYRRVKALASLRGRTVGEVVNEALTMWLSQRTNLDLMDKWDELDKQASVNNREYERLRPELIAKNRGNFVVIRSGTLVGVYRRREDANREASKSDGAQSIVAQLIAEKPRHVELGWSLLEEMTP